MHNLAVIGGQVAMAYDGLSPWHKLGRQLTEAGRTDVQQALREASMDWTVSKRETFYPDNSGSMVKSKLRSAIIRDTDGEELGSCGPRYTPIQNLEAFSVLTPAIEKAGVTIRTVGALGNGSVVWMLGRLGEGKEIVKGETVLPNFLIRTTHDGTGSDIGRLTPVDVVCHNTLQAAMSSGTDEFRIRHTVSAQDRLQEATRLVSILTNAWDETVETYRTLAETHISPDDVRQAVELLFPIPEGPDVTDRARGKAAKSRLDVAGLYLNGVGAKLRGPTAWGLYNAFTEYADHVQPAEVQENSKSAGRKARAYENAIFGSGLDLKLLALKAARQLVAA